jgi:hypothetical protein
MFDNFGYMLLHRQEKQKLWLIHGSWYLLVVCLEVKLWVKSSNFKSYSLVYNWTYLLVGFVEIKWRFNFKLLIQIWGHDDLKNCPLCCLKFGFSKQPFIELHLKKWNNVCIKFHFYCLKVGSKLLKYLDCCYPKPKTICENYFHYMFLYGRG